LSCAKGKANGVEVTVTTSAMSTSRFALNEMTQNQAPVVSTVSVRLLQNGRQVRVENSDLSQKGIESAVERALNIVQLLPEDVGLVPLPFPVDDSQYVPVNRFDLATAEASAKTRAQIISEILETGKESNMRTSGTYSTGSVDTAIGNSNGLFVYHRQSMAECSVTMESRTASGWAKANAVRMERLAPRDLAKRAAQAVILGNVPQDHAPGKYTVILTPSAVLDLLGFLWDDFAATRHADKLSSLLDKTGKKVFAETIDMADDFTHPEQSGAPFDGEGMPRQRVSIVEKGVLKQLVCGRRMAKQTGARTTGHGLPEPSAEGEAVQNFVMPGGNESLDQLIAGTENGILVSRVWYVRAVDPASVLLTGMTRDGTFLVKNGTIASAIKNLRFNVSVIEMLNNVLALGRSSRAAGAEYFPAVVPSMKVADFNFSSTARH